MDGQKEKYNGCITFYFVIDKNHSDNIADCVYAECRFYKTEEARKISRANWGITDMGEFAVAIPAVFPEEMRELKRLDWWSWGNLKKNHPELEGHLEDLIQEKLPDALGAFRDWLKQMAERADEIEHNGYYDIERGKEHEFDIKIH